MAGRVLPSVLTAGELAEVSDQVTILDVRSPAEYESEHIPGSFNVPLDQLPQYAASLRDTIHRPVVLVCRSGARARPIGTPARPAGESCRAGRQRTAAIDRVER